MEAKTATSQEDLVINFFIYGEQQQCEVKKQKYSDLLNLRRGENNKVCEQMKLSMN